MPRNHALIIGGTGILQPVTLGLAERYDRVTVIARTSLARRELRKKNIHYVLADYRWRMELHQALQHAILKHGDVDTAVMWVHDARLRTYSTVAQYIGTAKKPGHYFHVHGLEETDPAVSNSCLRDHFEPYRNIRYREVVLGCVPSESGKRWLTEGEICEGVLKAIDSENERFVVGTAELVETKA